MHDITMKFTGRVFPHYCNKSLFKGLLCSAGLTLRRWR